MVFEICATYFNHVEKALKYFFLKDKKLSTEDADSFKIRK